MKTLKEILDFVHHGGVFLDCGLAFCYMWKPGTTMTNSTSPFFQVYIGGSTKGKIRGFTGEYDPGFVLEPTYIPEAFSLYDTILIRYLGVYTTALKDAQKLEVAPCDERFKLIVEKNSSITEFRAPIRCESKDAKLIPILRAEYEEPRIKKKQECYPAIALKYGQGYLLLFGISLKREKPAEFDIVIRTVKKCCDLLKESGQIE